MILKPAEEAPHTGALFVEILLEAGVPPDVVSLVHGAGEGEQGVGARMREVEGEPARRVG